ncbi:hypothetical protein Tco_0887091 [Tanacetum coccineum]
MLRLEALGDHPLIKSGVNTMDKSAHTDMMNSQSLISARTDLKLVQRMKMFRRFDLWDETCQRRKHHPSQLVQNLELLVKLALLTRCSINGNTSRPPYYLKGNNLSSEYLRIKERELKRKKDETNEAYIIGGDLKHK